jgi:hypothetical protein
VHALFVSVITTCTYRKGPFPADARYFKGDEDLKDLFKQFITWDKDNPLPAVLNAMVGSCQGQIEAYKANQEAAQELAKAAREEKKRKEEAATKAKAIQAEKDQKEILEKQVEKMMTICSKLATAVGSTRAIVADSQEVPRDGCTDH